MSRAIELLVKMGDPKCISVEAINRGSGVLHKEQIIAAFALAERECPFGYHLLLAKYRQDEHSRAFATAYAAEWGAEMTCEENTVNALGYVVDMVTDYPLPAQQNRLKSLRNRYLRSQFSHIRAVERANQAAEESGLSPNSKAAKQLRIAELNELRKSTICPRCRGTGEIGRTKKHRCEACDGKGRLIANIGHLIKSLGCTEDYFKTYLNSIVVKFEQHCYVEMSNAENIIANRLRNEASG